MTKNKGFSLIEVLVTLLLTTIGILGMVVLQNKGIQYTQEAVNRDNAASLANDLIEIMRAHKDEFFENTPRNSYTYSEIKSSTDLYSTTGAFKFTKTNCADDPQTLIEQAGCWLSKVEDTLPGAGAADSGAPAKFKLCPSFSLDSHNIPTCAGSGYKGSTITVQLAWQVRDNLCDSSKESTEATICTYITRVEL